MTGTRGSTAPWRVLASRTVLLAGAFVVAAEGLLHTAPVRDVLPPSRVYYTNHVEPRLRALQATVRSEGRIDVLFVGSSIVRTNIRPLVFDSVHRAATGRDVVSFNGGLSGLPPDGVRLYLERFFLSRIDPGVVFQGVRFPELVRSEPASAVEALGHGLVEPLWMDPTPVNRVRSWVRENVELLHFQGLLARSFRSRRFPPPRSPTYPIDSRGWNGRDTTVAERISGGEVEPLASHPGQWDPDALDRGVEILRRTAELVRSRGGRYVLVNVPEHAAVFASRSAREQYAEYVKRLQRLADEVGVPLIDVTGGDPGAWGDDSWYYDGHHMSEEGARRFSVALARAWSSRSLSESALAVAAGDRSVLPRRDVGLLGASADLLLHPPDSPVHPLQQLPVDGCQVGEEAHHTQEEAGAE